MENTWPRKNLLPQRKMHLFQAPMHSGYECPRRPVVAAAAPFRQTDAHQSPFNSAPSQDGSEPFLANFAVGANREHGDLADNEEKRSDVCIGSPPAARLRDLVLQRKADNPRQVKRGEGLAQWGHRAFRDCKAARDRAGLCLSDYWWPKGR